MDDNHILYAQDGPVATITFNRPDARNSMTFAMYERLYELCEQADAEDSVRVVVLRGAGDKAFVSGTDIRQFQSFRTREDALGYEERISRVLGRVEDLSKPSIAMVQGDAAGGGLFMALVCDLRVAVDTARFGVPVARTLGNFPAPANFTRMVAAMGLFRTRSLLLTARLLDAAEAQQVGLVDEVVPRERLEARVRDLAERLAANAPLTMRAAKEATRRVMRAFALEHAEDILLSCYLSQDFQEGVSAFLEKRPAGWQGR